ncbi:trypsin-like peptidase domain-containing protein [bacterium]|nr:trypsin-like peptidase domain-containing protein [bacterium]
MKKTILKILAFFIIGMIGGIFAEEIFWPYFVERPFFYKYRLEQTPIYVTERKEITITENVALKEAIEKVKSTVIGVRTETKKGETLEGSGFVLTSDGLMVTLADLVPRGSNFSFFVDGEKVHFQILKRDLEENLALVKIKKENLPTKSFADLERLRLGERVFLVGVVFDTEGIPKKVVNEGIVKSFDKNLIETNIFENKNLQGSVLFDIEGNILGINQVQKTGQVTTIPITQIKQFAGF